MERIQSAITKARQARKTEPEMAELAEARPKDVAFPPVVVLEAPHAEAAHIEAAWTGLMAFRPNVRHLERGRVVSLTGGAAAAPFDGMRTRLLYLIRDKGWRRVAITSPGPGCGKTTVALNLALSLARIPEVRTVLVDADLRRPALARLLGASAHHQIADALAGKADPARHMLRVGDNLAIGTNHAPVKHSAELLQSPAIVAALDAIEAEFAPTLMLFDLPPLLASDDATAALGLLDCVFIVAAAESTTVAEVDRCEQELAAHTNVAGVVLNKSHYHEKSKGYGYYY